MNFTVTLEIKSIDDMINLGIIIGHYIKFPYLITLNGDLGTGKTLLARSIINTKLGYNAQVTSPSYLICLTYQDVTCSNTISHIDPYRLKQHRPLSALVDYSEVIKHLCILEWAKLAPDLENIFLFKLNITIEYSQHPEERAVIISTNDDYWKDILTKFNSDDHIYTPIVKTAKSPEYYVHRSHNPIILGKHEYILGIETSCDDTCAAILNGHGDILANCKIGQEEIHCEYGGVVPHEAQKAHKKNIDKVVNDAFEKAGIDKSCIKVVSVTKGPGLQVCLLIGLEYSHKFCVDNNSLLIYCNHLESHAVVPMLPSLNLNISYPFLSVLVSGGHTMILYVKNIGDYEVISSTIDDSIGECFDKIARELGITAVPGGPELEKLAENGTYIHKINSPFIKASPHNMSFSGVKASVLRIIRKSQLSYQDKCNIATSFQHFSIKYLLKKVNWSLKFLLDQNYDVNCVVITGGVASNKYLRDEFDKNSKYNSISVVYPPINLCTDNGVMVAWNGIEKIKRGIYYYPEEISTSCAEAYSRWNLC